MLLDNDLMHGTDWHGQNLAGRLLSEKLDGCRAAWDGSAMWSRGGNQIAIPENWRAELPAIPLDGEIWAGRCDFLQARLAVQYGRFTPSLRFMVFDAMIRGDYATRLTRIRRHLTGTTVACLVEQIRCDSTADAVRRTKAIQRRDGEGMIARVADAPYQAGRSSQILKLKNV